MEAIVVKAHHFHPSLHPSLPPPIPPPISPSPLPPSCNWHMYTTVSVFLYYCPLHHIKNLTCTTYLHHCPLALQSGIYHRKSAELLMIDLYLHWDQQWMDLIQLNNKKKQRRLITVWVNEYLFLLLCSPNCIPYITLLVIIIVIFLEQLQIFN